jgi:hypothetical protein
VIPVCWNPTEPEHGTATCVQSPSFQWREPSALPWLVYDPSKMATTQSPNTSSLHKPETPMQDRRSHPTQEHNTGVS